MFVTLAKFSYCIYNYSRIKQIIARSIDKELQALLNGGRSGSIKKAQLEVASEGGIPEDVEGLEIMRNFSLSLVPKLFKNQRPVADWDRTVIHDIVCLVRQKGGSVVFFQMPLNSLFLGPLTTPIRIADALSFKQACKRWKVSAISTNIQCSDSDFPDYSHLSLKRRAEFTRLLALAYLAGR